MMQQMPGKAIFSVRIFGDGTCWLADLRQSHGKHGRRIGEQELHGSAAKALIAVVAAALPLSDDPPREVDRGGSRDGVMEIFLKTVAESERRDYCDALLDSARVAIQMGIKGVRSPKTRGLHKLLSAAGFFPLGVVKVDGRTRWFWSRTPNRFFEKSGYLDTARIRDFLDDL